MKKFLGIIVAVFIVMGVNVYAATYINNEDVSSSVFTTISNDYTLFPVRYLGEKLGCDVHWNPDDKCITVSKGDIHRDFYNGSSVVYDWSGNSYNLVTAPKLVDGNTMVPAEFYRDHFGISVIWDDLTKSLFINSEDTYNWLIGTWEYQEALKKYNQISYDEAVSLVKNYFITYQGVEPPGYTCWDETDDKWVIRAYDNIYYNGQYSHSPAFGIISVNKNTGALYDEVLLHPITDDNGNYVGWMY